MCHVCKGKFSVQEKIAAHNFTEQMYEFYGLQIKEPKKRKLTKKSMLGRIEYKLTQLQREQDTIYRSQLENLLNQSFDDIISIEKQFNSIMETYYREKLGDGFNAG